MQKHIKAREARVLIVDDDVISHIIIGKQLTCLGINKFTCVSNGKQAVDAFDQSIWNLIFMDHDMPIQNGSEATSEIRRREVRTGGRVPIIAITGSLSPTIRDAFLKSGADEFIQKPINIKQIIEVINRWITC